MNNIDIVNADNGNVTLGESCSIGRDIQIIFIGKGSVTIADYVTLGDNVKMIIEGGHVSIGDWSTLHNDTKVFSKAGVTIGEHCWFGQNTVIDGTGGITIENGVRVGMFSQLWTHVAAGEQIEGCTLFAETPTHIESDVWLVGTCTVGSGVRIGRRTVALAGSNIIKSCPPQSVLAGMPAKPKDGVSFYRDVSLEEKFVMLEGWLRAAPFADGAVIVTDHADGVVTVTLDDSSRIFFYRDADRFEKHVADDKSDTSCCIETKRYVKTFSSAERRVLKYLSGNKARFFAHNNIFAQ